VIESDVEEGRGGAGGAPLPLRLLALGWALCLAELASFYWKTPLGPRGVTAADWLDLASTYAIVLLYGWVLLAVRGGRGVARPAPFPRPVAVLLALAAITWILGRGVHVAANSLHDWLDHARGLDAWGLFTFWDETLGHLLADLGTIGFAIGITWTEEASGGIPRVDRGGRAWILAGAPAYGFIYFAGAVEGRTVPVTLPWCFLYLAWGIAASRAGPAAGGARPARLYFLAAFATALVLFAIWGTLHGGFPEFSAVGFGP
jgi:hypothetical protein